LDSASETNPSSTKTSSAALEQTNLNGLTNLWINRHALVESKVNHRRALFVLGKIDEILAWEQTVENEKDSRFVDLGRYLCEARSGQYWRIDNLQSFDEFLEKKFPESRRKAYYLMAIHEQLPRQIRHDLKQVGWTKAAELAKVARRDGQRFDCATWLHSAKELSKDEFKRTVERHLTGQETEPWEIIYFKVYRSQLGVIERALETAALMLGSDKSRGYCLEMICADFMAGARLNEPNPQSLVESLNRLFQMLPDGLRGQLLDQFRESNEAE
jgi:hypothetical protein